MESQYYSNVKRLLIITIFLTLLTFLGINNYTQDDTWRHLALGELFLKSGLPANEPYAIAPSLNYFIDYSWLSCIVFYFIYNGAGETGLIIFSSFCFALTLFILCYRRKINFNWLLVSFSTSALILVAIRWRIAARPESISFVFLAILFRWLFSKTELKPIYLFFLSMIWMNFHASAIVIPVFIFLKLITDSLHNRKLSFRNFLCLSLSFFGCLATPWGAQLFISSVQQGYIPINKYIYEYQPMSFQGWTPYRGPLLLVLLCINILSYKLNKTRFSLKLISYALCILMSLKYARGLPFAYFVLVPSIIDTLTYVLQLQHKKYNYIKLAFIISTFTAVSSFALNESFGLSYIRHASMRASELLLSSPVRGRILNDFSFGGYLMWLGKDRYKLFIDNRSPVYATTTFPEYLELSADGACQKTLEKYNFEAILMPPPAMCISANGTLKECWNLIKCYKQKDWALVYISETALLFVKRKSDYLDFISTHEYHYLDPLPKTTQTLAEQIKIALATEQGRIKYTSELKRALHLEPLDNKLHLIKNLFDKLKINVDAKVINQITNIR